MKNPEHLRYTETHEWLDPESGRVGITEYAQSQLGDLVHVELPEVGKEVARGEAVAVLDSVKTSAEVYAPVTGKVVAIHEALQEHPELINTDPYGEGWIFQLEVSDTAELEGLLTASDYESRLEEG